MPIGRQTKLTPNLQDAICERIAGGQTYSTACRLEGIHDSTFYRWKEKGVNATSGAYRDFREAVQRAKDESEAILIAIIRKEAEEGREEVSIVRERDAKGNITKETTTTKKSPRDARIALAMLERRNPDDWGRRVVDHRGLSGDKGANATVNLSFNGNDGITRAPSADTEYADDVEEEAPQMQ